MYDDIFEALRSFVVWQREHEKMAEAESTLLLARMPLVVVLTEEDSAAIEKVLETYDAIALRTGITDRLEVMDRVSGALFAAMVHDIPSAVGASAVRTNEILNRPGTTLLLTMIFWSRLLLEMLFSQEVVDNGESVLSEKVVPSDNGAYAVEVNPN